MVIGHSLTGKGQNTAFIGLSNSTWPIYNTMNIAAWSVISDERLKKNIKNFDKGLPELMKL